MSYECHITLKYNFNKKRREIVEEYAEAYGWKTSLIKGDPLLGADSFFYLTCHKADYETIRLKMGRTVVDMRSLKFEVLREKIEQIVWDSRSPVKV